MHTLPYKHYFVVSQYNNSMNKILFDEVVNYGKYLELDFDDFKSTCASVALSDCSAANELLLGLCQTWLNAQDVAEDFAMRANIAGLEESDACAIVLIDIKNNCGGTTVQVLTQTHKNKRIAFEHIADFASYDLIDKSLRSLSDKRGAILFDL